LNTWDCGLLRREEIDPTSWKFSECQGIVPHSIQPLLHSQHFCQHARSLTAPRFWRTGYVSTWSETLLFFGKSDWQIWNATPVDHRLDYGEFLQERPRAYEENEDWLFQGLMVRLALWRSGLTRSGASSEQVRPHLVSYLVRSDSERWPFFLARGSCNLLERRFTKFSEITQRPLITPFKVIQGHRCW